MKIFRLPPDPGALIFDMDLTLYSSPAYGKAQNEGLIAKLGEYLGKSFEETLREVEERRLAWAASRNGARPSMSNIYGTYGVSMEDNIRWRQEICDPSPYIKEDPLLRETLRTLAPCFALGVITNNPASTARKTLAALGVEDLFALVTGLDTYGVPKPHTLPFAKMAAALGFAPEQCVSIGDRYDIDLRPPLELGMGAVLVSGVEEVYQLPGLFGLLSAGP